MAYIYSITNLENQKIYVGKTTQPNPYDRWKQHLQLARNKNNLNENNSAHSMPIIRAISKYGADQFKFRVLEECIDDKVNERETYWIERLNSCGKNGYNITLGGEGVKKPRQYWTNHPNSKAVSCYTLEGELVRDYDTAGVAADTLGNKKASNCIRTCIKGITFQALGYRWAWKGEQPKLIEKRINRRGVIYAIHLNSERKKVWKSAADAAEEIEGNRKNNNAIHHSLNSPNKAKLQSKGWYFFRKKNDALSDWKPATKNRGTEYYKKLVAKSNEKRKRPVRGVNIKTGEMIEFNSITEASFFIKGEGNYKAVANIVSNIKRIQNGETWCYSFGYKWYYL
jgi:group I intron endonuclease